MTQGRVDREVVRSIGRGQTDPSRPGNPNTAGHSQPGDAGKTSGGGSSGHDQPDDVAEQSRTRNQGRTRDAGTLRERRAPEPEAEGGTS